MKRISCSNVIFIILASQITSKLYTRNGNDLGLDAISLDIERGRDHGLPGYNYYRKYCGLPVAKSFDDFLDYIPTQVGFSFNEFLRHKRMYDSNSSHDFQMVRKLHTTYSHPNDVDLIVGGMAERSVNDGMIGPTFHCLIYEQFFRSRRTDRFFYDSAMQPHPFTSGKLNSDCAFCIIIFNSTSKSNWSSLDRATISATQYQPSANILRQRWQHHAHAAERVPQTATRVSRLLTATP